ncbi:MAG: transcriptional regulator GcvA [Hyphomicrobium sp.]
MNRKLPPLNALRAFEAAARHESLTRAAAELNVTHAAISRHVRDLEQVLRVRLFERTGRGVILTEPGRTLVKDLTQAFDLLASAAARFARPGRRRRLTITSDPPFAAFWLVPRLSRFTLAHPGIDLVLDPSPRIVDFDKEDADIGIRFGAGFWRGVEAEKLADAALTVVCSPMLIAARPLASPAALPPGALIQELDRSYWRMWLEAAGVGDRIVPSGPTLLADLTLSAAEAGQGFALSDRLLAAEALAANRLVCPFDISVPLNAYYLVHRQGALLSKAAADFRRWMLIEMQRTQVTLAALDRSAISVRQKTAAPRKGPSAPKSRRPQGTTAVSGTKRTRNPPTT